MSEPNLSTVTCWQRLCLFAVSALLAACATTGPGPQASAESNRRIANLHRAAALPWVDEGRCVVEEASNEWPVLVERCFPALDAERIRFQDVTGRCAVASAGAVLGVGVCILAAPEIILGAVIVTGVVVVAVAIQEQLEAHERLRRANPEASSGKAKPVAESTPGEPQAEPAPDPKGSRLGRDWFPPGTLEPSERPECKAIPGPQRGGNDPHNQCADKIPGNDFPGLNVLVNGKSFDALVMATLTLWEVKTDDFGKHSRRSQEFLAKVKLPELQREARLARQCGYDFVVGVRSPAHKAMLLELDRNLKVVVMDWC